MTHSLPKVLVIDSDLDAIELARFALWRSGLPCTFHWFDDAELANATLLTQALCRSRDLPSLILMDPRFYGSEGYDLLHTLCVYPAIADIPLMLFTSQPQHDDFGMAQDSRIWYAAKPKDPREYMDHIVDCVQSRLHDLVV